MASILDRYGIKEVADLTFYSIDATTGRPRTPVLYIDTAKVSTVESTAETSYAEGGKGNGRLIAWDFGKEITMTIEDAVFSPKSLSIMFGDGSAPSSTIDVTLTEGKIYRTIVMKKADIIKELGTGNTFVGRMNKAIKDAIGIDNVFASGANLTGDAGTASVIAYTTPESEISSKNYALKLQVPQEATPGAFSAVSGQADLSNDAKIFVSFYVTPTTAYQIDVGPDTFPGTYYITADTYARSEGDGSDQFFQIIIPKGKITSENTLTMEADGDPTVFNMNVEVLRATVGTKNVMMQLVQYNFGDSSSSSDDENPLDWRIDAATSTDVDGE